MKRVVSVTAVVAIVVLLTGTALAQMGGWMGRGMGAGMGPGMMGGGWMGGGPGPANCPGLAAADETAGITEEKAKGLAEEYAEQYLPGFTVERVLPFTGRFHTMYQAELKGPAGEARVLHINPWGNVMPSGGRVIR